MCPGSLGFPGQGKRQEEGWSCLFCFESHGNSPEVGRKSEETASQSRQCCTSDRSQANGLLATGAVSTGLCP